MKYALALLLAFAVIGCTTKEAQIRTAVDLSREHFKRTATVEDDSLDTLAKINTFEGFQREPGTISGLLWDDNFLRAFIDKKTGRTSFQLYQVIMYQGDGWRFYDTASHEAPSGPQSKTVTYIKRDVSCSGSMYRGCTYDETVAFDVEEDLLRKVAANYSPGLQAGWDFKFSARSGTWYKDRMLAAEIAGLLDAVDDYLGRKGFAHSSAN